MEKVLVTGATGYIGLHCIHQLLNQGYAVNGSVRSPERKDEIFESLKNHNTSTENLNIFVFDLNDDEGWDEGWHGGWDVTIRASVWRCANYLHHGVKKHNNTLKQNGTSSHICLEIFI